MPRHLGDHLNHSVSMIGKLPEEKEIIRTWSNSSGLLFIDSVSLPKTSSASIRGMTFEGRCRYYVAEAHRAILIYTLVAKQGGAFRQFEGQVSTVGSQILAW